MRKANKNNVLSEDFPVIGCDIGCSHAKLTWYDQYGTLQRFVVPSEIYEAFAPLSFIDEDESGVNYRSSGRVFNFHEACGVPPFNTKQPSYPYSVENAVILHHALRLAGFEGDVSIAISMPYDDFYSNVGKNIDNIERKKKSIMIDVTNDDNNINIVNVEVFPEAIIGAYGCYVDDAANNLYEIQQGLLIVDLGGRTSDIVHATSSWMPSRTGRKSTHAFGYLDLLDNLNEQLRDLGFGSVPPTILKKAIDNGYIRKGENKIDIRKQIKQSRESLLSRVETAIDSWVRDGITIDGILFIGGAVEDFREELSHIKDSFIADNPQFANSRACAIVGNL